MVQGYVPKRGDVVRITPHTQAGREQAGRRPAMVLSPSAYTGRAGLAILCPITSHAKGYPFEVNIPKGHSVVGVILADQAKSLDWRAKDAALVSHLPPKTMREVLRKLDLLLRD